MLLLLLKYRSPEEYLNNPLNEKIDVWSFGNNLYGLLTGRYIYYDLKNDDEAKVYDCIPNFSWIIVRDTRLCVFSSYDYFLSLFLLWPRAERSTAW